MYFVGGAKGVGKSSLLREVSKQTGLLVVNTGDFFREATQSYQNNVKEIAKKNIILYFCESVPAIADTHYAGFLDGIYNGRFERGLHQDELGLLAQNVDLELILIDLDPLILRERRIDDANNDRDHLFESIRKEIEANRIYFDEYCLELGKKGVIIENIDFDDSLKQLCKLVK